MVKYIIIAVLIFGVLIGLHEFGHFIAAKAFGVPVMEFSIGMGPLLFQRKKGETDYSLRLLPIGGYCAMEGELRQPARAQQPKALEAVHHLCRRRGDELPHGVGDPAVPLRGRGRLL